jgi:methylmalonyl-CoA mutase
MPQNPLDSLLLEIFPKSNKEIWKQTASREIEGREPFDSLSWESSDEINFFPYYEYADATHLNYLKKFRHIADENSFLGPRRWWSVPQVPAGDAKKANASSLEHLANGADGIFYRLNSSPDLKILLEKIEWPYCSLFFHSSDNFFYTRNLPEYLSAIDVEPDSLTGALFWEICPKKSDVNFYLIKTPRLKSLGIIVPPASPVVEIAEALSQGVRLIEEMKETSSQVFSAIAFSISIGTNFFESIAKLKALRILWYQISQAYAIKDFQPSDLHIHAASLPWIKADYEPHGNLIKSTTASMAAIFGGCNSLTILPQDEENKTFSRVARNVSSILREESHFNKVADPVAGAYAIDIMVDAISKKAWTLFQSKLAA